MMESMPKFAESPYFVPEMGNWHLKEGAPQEIVEEFNAYMEEQKRNKEAGVYT